MEKSREYLMAFIAGYMYREFKFTKTLSLEEIEIIVNHSSKEELIKEYSRIV